MNPEEPQASERGQPPPPVWRPPPPPPPPPVWQQPPPPPPPPPVWQPPPPAAVAPNWQPPPTDSHQSSVPAQEPVPVQQPVPVQEPVPVQQPMPVQQPVPVQQLAPPVFVNTGMQAPPQWFEPEQREYRSFRWQFWAVLIGAIVVFFVVVGAFAAIRNAANAGRVGPWTYPGEDGRSNLPGENASIEYPPSLAKFEAVSDANAGGGPHDSAVWTVKLKGNQWVTLRHLIFEPALTTQSDIDAFIKMRGDINHSHTLSGPRPEPKTVVLGGRTGYAWSFVDTNGAWQYQVIFPATVHSIFFECSNPSGRDRSFRRTCRRALSTIVFSGSE